MTFVSLTFGVFLSIVFALYWLCPNRKAQNAVLVVFSYVFYGWWDYRYLALIVVSSLVDFVAGYGLGKVASQRSRRAVLLVSICTNLGLLGAFKYFNFFVDSFAELAAALGWHVTPVVLNVALPVGISFYTFQTMSYTIDIYYGRVPACRSLLDYLAYVAFFPQLVAGPIERAKSLLGQMEDPRTFSYEDSVDGWRQMLWGYFKKVVIADWLATYVDKWYAQPATSTGPQLWVATFFFAVQIYCDFSGYSDIAIGVAKLFGFQLRRNFAYPYFSQSVTEFWRRWHISLSTWFRDYVYIPLGGNRVTFRRELLNVLLTFGLCGLWHGASWHFLLWGVVHGIYLCAERIGKKGRLLGLSDAAGGDRLIPGPLVLLRMARTFLLVLVAWVLFRAQTMADVFIVLKKMCVDIWHASSYAGLSHSIDDDLLRLLVLFLAIEWLSRKRLHPLAAVRLPQVVRWGVYSLMVWWFLYSCPDKQTTFIYFQF